MKDAREILISTVPNACYWRDMDNLVNTPVHYVETAMDEYAKEFLLAYLELNGVDEKKAKHTVDEAFRILT